MMFQCSLVGTIPGGVWPRGLIRRWICPVPCNYSWDSSEAARTSLETIIGDVADHGEDYGVAWPHVNGQRCSRLLDIQLGLVILLFREELVYHHLVEMAAPWQ